MVVIEVEADDVVVDGVWCVRHPGEEKCIDKVLWCLWGCGGRWRSVRSVSGTSSGSG